MKRGRLDEDITQRADPGATLDATSLPIIKMTSMVVSIRKSTRQPARGCGGEADSLLFGDVQCAVVAQ